MEILWTGPEGAATTLVLAHGAGAAMDSPWLDRICALLGERGIRTARFEFAYMAGRRTGSRRPAPKAELVMDEYRDAVAGIRADAGGRLLIGGKSYGGRVASMVADDLGVDGLVCLGYPFHPPEKPGAVRVAHLRGLATTTLICQGTRDPFGGVDEVAGYELSPAIEIAWFDGVHDIAPLGRLSAVTDAVASFAGSARVSTPRR